MLSPGCDHVDDDSVRQTVVINLRRYCAPCADPAIDELLRERCAIAGMAALSRFMIFVWMEAFAQKWYLKCGDNKVHRIELTDWRDHAFWCAWQKGLLTVSW